MKKIYIVFLFSLMKLQGQSKTIDSLRTDLKVNPKNKFWTYNELAYNFTSTSLDSLNYYNDLSKKHAKTELEKKNTELLDVVLLLSNQKFNEASYKVLNIIEVFKRHNDYKSLGSAYNLLAKIYNLLGDFKKSEESMYDALIHVKKSKKRKLILKSYINYASALMQSNKIDKGIEYFVASEKYMANEDFYEKGIVCLNLSRVFLDKKMIDKTIKNSLKSIKYLKKANASLFYFDSYLCLIECYIEIKNTVKAEEYLKLAYKEIKDDYDKSNLFYVHAQIQMLKSNYISAKKLIEQSVSIDQVVNSSKLGEDYLILAEIEYHNKNYQNTNSYIEKAITIFKENREETNLIESYNLLFKNHFKQENKKSLFERYIDFLKISDTIQVENQKQSIIDLQTKYETVEKEARIKTQQLQIEQEKTNKYIAFGSVGFLLLLSGGGYFWFSSKQKQTQLETQNTLLGLQQNINAMALQNLNQQLNPHEIKNLLGSISPEIQEKAPDAYKKMVKLFNLTKASLNSSSITDSLSNQVEQIEGFLSLEKSMLIEPLSYSIQNKTENHEIEIPRLLLKNLVENCVKHGIKGKENGGLIAVNIAQENNFVIIEVDDTGKGRQNAISLDSGIGTSTYQKLFATLNQKNKDKASFEIIDKQQGTKVKVIIPLDYKYQ